MENDRPPILLKYPFPVIEQNQSWSNQQWASYLFTLTMAQENIIFVRHVLDESQIGGICLYHILLSDTLTFWLSPEVMVVTTSL